VIHAVLPRKTQLCRKTSGREMEEQVLVANIDVVFVVQGLDATFNPRRLQRHLLMAREGGALPVVLLNKTDLCPEIESLRATVREAAGETPVISLSALTGENMEGLKAWLNPGRTIVFIGASGVGKSTLINRLCGEDLQPTADVRGSDSKGRHTTTCREMLLLPNGALVIDTPGMREFHLWTAEDGLQETFPDVEELAVQCHFPNCAHTSEKRCAILEALSTGRLAQERYDNYMKLKQELDYIEKAHSRSGSSTRKYKPPGRFTHKTRR
jgi:ribosome biogenesis GTPase / thiamine phosphate phosphatase